MRLIPVFFSVMLGAISLVVVSHAFAEEGSSNRGQYEPLDDEALEKEYGIKAGAVQRDAPHPSEAEPGSAAVSGEDGEDTDTEGGTGGTGSADDAVENGEDEQSRKDNNG